MTLAELLRFAAPTRVAGPVDVPVAGLRHDSREVVAGDLFFAMPGHRTDGNRHARQALDNGAVAVLSELEPPPPPAVMKGTWAQVSDVAEAMARVSDAFFAHPSGAMTVVGVTGTNGKTTTTYFLESIVRACGGVPAVVGTVDYRMGGKTLQKAPNTTPVSLELL
ncbi:MAG: UDP-N-acetylmuramoyl-L-alanyl-D-glutamate--2,6-diaminopimelate ligase, partial [Elusimicrobia bacterium]|nr:UDP-N-acetylmuramoyl-L-alanyl-D-glutamate--2,6-diaminopimelate ligase [Elusimicrobiota bacterium]